MPERSHEVFLRFPATREDFLIPRMALSGLGMLAGLDVDLIGDLRTVTNECCDCLAHRALWPERIALEAWVSEGRLVVRFTAEGGLAPCDEKPLDLEITRGVLETLMPEVALETDEHGVSGIVCSMPV